MTLALFAALGLALELLHATKAPGLLDVGNEARRALWRLGHAHGALLGIVHLVYAATLPSLPGSPTTWRRLPSRCLSLATLLLPSGFLLGGAWAHDGIPWVGVLLTPVGGLALAVAVFLIALGIAEETT